MDRSDWTEATFESTSITQKTRLQVRGFAYGGIGLDYRVSADADNEIWVLTRLNTAEAVTFLEGERNSEERAFGYAQEMAEAADWAADRALTPGEMDRVRALVERVWPRWLQCDEHGNFLAEPPEGVDWMDVTHSGMA